MEDSYQSESEDNNSYSSSDNEDSYQSPSDNSDEEINILNSESANIVTQDYDDEDSMSLNSSNSKSGNIDSQQRDEDECSNSKSGNTDTQHSNEEDSVSSYDKTQDNKIYQKSIDKFVNQALGNEENNKRKNNTSNTSNKRNKTSNRSGINIDKENNVHNLQCINESRNSFANTQKKKKALLHANKYLKEADVDEFPFKTVEEITFEQIDNNVGNIVGK